MTLPLCVRIDFSDERSCDALLADGWRGIEVLNIFERDGLPLPPLQEDGVIVTSIAEPDDEFVRLALDAMSSVRNGRLWADLHVNPKAAAQTYRTWVESAAKEALSGRIQATYESKPAGFMLVGLDKGRARITFFAVKPEYRGFGVGKALLRRAMSLCGPVLRAGTQATNEPASRLYTSMGFRIVEQQRTFHKP